MATYQSNTAQRQKKKIVVFLPEFPAISETFIQRDLSKLVEKDEIEIDIVTLKKGNQELAENLKDRVFVEKMSVGMAIISVITVLKNLKTYFNFYKVVKENGGGGLKDMYLILKSFGYAKIIGTHKPDEIHAHFLSDISTIAMFSAAMLDIPFSLNTHARDVTEYPHLPELKIKLCKFVTVCNKAAYEELVKIAGEYSDKIHLIHHCHTPEIAFPFDKVHQKPEIFTIFTGGTRLTEKKGLIYLIEASKKLKEADINHRVIIYGAGSEYENLKSIIDEYELENVYDMTGKTRPYSVVAKKYFEADVFVLPNIVTDKGDQDGIPTVMIEAALAGLPIITTDAGSNSELAIDGKTAIVVGQHDVDGLVEAVKQVLSLSESAKESMISEAKIRADELFGDEVTINNLNNLLLL